MNLETFKARARRKLQLPFGRSAAESADAPATNPATSTPLTGNTPTTVDPRSTGPVVPKNTKPTQTVSASAPAQNSVPSDNKRKATAGDEFSAALKLAQRTTPDSATDGPIESDSRSPKPSTFQALTGSPATNEATTRAKTQTTTRATAEEAESIRARSTDNTTGDAEFQHLRSLLLGESYEKQQDQIDVVYQRTQVGIDSLRHDMDARLSDLTEYVEQLEQSILNGLESQKEAQREAQSSSTGGLGENAIERLAQSDAQLDAQLTGMDTRMGDMLDRLRSDIEIRRQEDRAFLEQELQNVNSRTDNLLADFSERLDNSLTNIQGHFTEQLHQSPNHLLAATSGTSAGLTDDTSQPTISSVRAQLIDLIDERITTFNREQSIGLGELRETLLANTNAIKSELRSQTEEQRRSLANNRTELEAQFNTAITTLNESKVSHKELSQLLSRLADRVQQL